MGINKETYRVGYLDVENLPVSYGVVIQTVLKAFLITVHDVLQAYVHESGRSTMTNTNARHSISSYPSAFTILPATQVSFLKIISTFLLMSMFGIDDRELKRLKYSFLLDILSASGLPKANTQKPLNDLMI
jgi:hypothetical protein